MSVTVAAALMAVMLVAPACGDDAATDPVTTAPDVEVGKGDQAGISANWKPRIDEMWLHVDLAERRGQATIWLEPGTHRTVSLEAGGLHVDEIWNDDGPVRWQLRDGALHVAHAADDGPFSVDYTFDVHGESQGYGPNGSTVVWPYFCGNLFPCRSGPADGMTFELSLAGFADGVTAIYPETLPAEAPSYTLAFAVGRYTCQSLGKTKAGTEVSVCWLPNGKNRALAGTRHLVAAFGWLERHIGKYTFGSDVASVAVNWGPSAAGGMEHHPYWHVATSEMNLPITHVHEAVHGWYGTGVRMECWEDFVLSEGTTSYLAARALGAVTDAATEAAIWDEYREELLLALADDDIIAWPDTCGAVDLLADGLFSNIVYMKGAFFWRAVAEEIGKTRLDEVLARFYAAHVGKAARMGDLLAALEKDTGFDPTELADFWLRSHGDPFAD